MTDQSKNQLIANRYSVLQTLGEGGMGVVLLCHDATLNRKVAVKLLALGADMDYVQRFQIEAKAAARLKHDNILQVMDFGESDGRFFLVMDYLDGITLAQLIRLKLHLEAEDAIPIFLQICDGIAHAHKNGVLHRDIKPSNIMLVDSGSGWDVKIVDFGIAKLTSMIDQKLTSTGTVVGSPLYMSPEAGLGQRCDFSSDIYSLGCLMYETLTGKPPFHGDTAFDTIMMHKNEAAKTMAESSGKYFEPRLEHVVARCMEKEPRLRFQTIEQLRNELLNISNTIAFEEKEHSEPPTHSSGSYKRVIVVSSIAIASFCILAAITLSQTKVESVTTTSPPIAISETTSVAVDLAREYGEKSFAYNQREKTVKGSIAVDDDYLDQHASMYPSAKSWNLQQTQINGSGLKSLLRYPIENLELKETQIDKDAIVTVSQMRNLEYLDIAECRKIGPDDLEPLAKLTRLRNIHISVPSDKLNSTRMMTALTKLPKLEVVAISGLATVDTVRELKKLPGIRQLNLAISPKGLDSLALGRAFGDLPHLTHLYMDNDTLNAVALRELGRRQEGRNERLKHLYIVLRGKADGVESLSTLDALKELPDLKSLTIDGAIDAGSVALLAQLPKLEELRLPKTDYSAQTKQALQQLRCHCSTDLESDNYEL